MRLNILPNTFLHRLSKLTEPRWAMILGLGFASGLPLLITLSTLGYWFSTIGIDKSTIGLFAAVGLPYSFKFLWAPLLDHLAPPTIVRRFGQRRGWALVFQFFLTISVAMIGLSNPHEQLLFTALASIAVAFFAASQDIVLDAWRIELLERDEQAMGSAIFVYGYRIGMLIAGGGAFALSDFVDWPFVFYILAMLIIACMFIVLLANEPHKSNQKKEHHQTLLELFKQIVIKPFSEFVQRYANLTLPLLLLIVLYKFGDAILGPMANPFYHEMGYSGFEIGSITKIWGFWATLIGIGTGGVLALRVGLFYALIIAGIAQAVTNLFFVWIALGGDSLTGSAIAFLDLELEIDNIRLLVAISSDNFTGGLATAIFVAFLGALCNRDFTATQFALLSSFSSFGRTLLSIESGWLVEQLGWVNFFLITIILAVPALSLLIWLRYKKAAILVD